MPAMLSDFTVAVPLSVTLNKIVNNFLPEGQIFGC